MSGQAGLFVAIEGVDGAGTTTQTRAVGEALERAGHSVHRTFEPSAGPVGVLIRQALAKRLRQPDGAPLDPAALALLFAADRLDHLSAEVVPALDQGRVVICDRYLLSSLVYQGLDLPEQWVEEVNARARPPDVTFFLEVTPETAGRRREGRGGAEELFEAAALQEKIAGRYAAVYERRKGRERIHRVDGSLPAKDVTDQLVRAILGLLQG